MVMVRVAAVRQPEGLAGNVTQTPGLQADSRRPGAARGVICYFAGHAPMMPMGCWCDKLLYALSSNLLPLWLCANAL